MRPRLPHTLPPRPPSGPWPSSLAAVLAAILLAVFAAGQALAAGAAAGAELDPKDGPDVDLRIIIEDGEVRLQIITNLAFIDVETEAWREIESTLTPDESRRAADALYALFVRENQVTIDGVAVAPLPIDPAIDFEFDAGDPSLYPLMPSYGARAVARTRLTLRYPCKTPPKRVAVQWGVWPPNESLPLENGVRPPIEIKARLTADGREAIVSLSQGEPEHTWHRPAGGAKDYLEEVPEVVEAEGPSVPWPRVALLATALGFFAFGPRALRRTLFGPLALGAGVWTALGVDARRVELPDEARAAEIFESLHANIYRAFEFTEESRVYDVLAESAAGDVLRTLYDDVYRSLVLQEQGGAIGRAERVEYLDIEVESIGELERSGEPGIVLAARWRVYGVVYHFGHGHTQESEYLARYVIEARAEESGWRITDYVPLEQRRVDAQPLPEFESKRAPEWKSFGDGDLPEEF